MNIMKNETLKAVVIGAAGYVGLKCVEALASNLIDNVSTAIDAFIQFKVFDGQKKRGITSDECGCHEPLIGFQIPSEEESELEEEEDDTEGCAPKEIIPVNNLSSVVRGFGR